ncbi:MAG: superoxide dismutase family protein [Acidobacteria bacterium]|nr:superoxide dismutase family protein [Acidobacteriota bacterium]
MPKSGSLTVLLLLGAVIVQMGCGPAQQPAEQSAAPATRTAQATLRPTEGNRVEGTVHFEEDMGEMHVEFHVTGLTPGKHGFHIHETGDCSAPDASSAGGHFNPDGTPHGAPDAAQHHAGDLGNIEPDSTGMAMADIHSTSLALEGANSIIGKAVIVHAGEDDLTSQPDGNAGPRLACGVIQ